MIIQFFKNNNSFSLNFERNVAASNHGAARSEKSYFKNIKIKLDARFDPSWVMGS